MKDDKWKPERPQTSSFYVALLLFFFQKDNVCMGGGGLNEGYPIKYRMPNLRDRYKKMFTVYLKYKFYPVDLHLFIFFFSLFLLLSLATLL